MNGGRACALVQGTPTLKLISRIHQVNLVGLFPHGVPSCKSIMRMFEVNPHRETTLHVRLQPQKASRLRNDVVGPGHTFCPRLLTVPNCLTAEGAGQVGAHP